MAEFKDGKFHGKGAALYNNGDKYSGEFRYGDRDGEGIYTFSNGNTYKGQFKSNQFHGKGKFFNSESNKIIEGEWRNGKFIDNPSISIPAPAEI